MFMSAAVHDDHLCLIDVGEYCLFDFGVGIFVADFCGSLNALPVSSLPGWRVLAPFPYGRLMPLSRCFSEYVGRSVEHTL